MVVGFGCGRFNDIQSDQCTKSNRTAYDFEVALLWHFELTWKVPLPPYLDCDAL